jgi:hypothetical protein
MLVKLTSDGKFINILQLLLRKEINTDLTGEQCSAYSINVGKKSGSFHWKFSAHKIELHILCPTQSAGAFASCASWLMELTPVGQKSFQVTKSSIFCTSFYAT